MDLKSPRFILSLIIVGAFVLITVIFAIAPILAGTSLDEVTKNFNLFSSAYSGIVGIIVGFYFATALGSMSSAFEIIDPSTQKIFESHFTSILERAEDKVLLELSTPKSIPSFNEKMCAYLRKALSAKIGEKETDELTRKN